MWNVQCAKPGESILKKLQKVLKHLKDDQVLAGMSFGGFEMQEMSNGVPSVEAYAKLDQ